MHSCARSNTALFRISAMPRSALTNLRRLGAHAATDFSCAAAPPADAKSCVIAARAAAAPRAVAVANAVAEPLRPRMGTPAAAKGAVRALLRQGEAAHPRRLYLLSSNDVPSGPPRLGILISRKHAAAAVGPQPHQAMHPGSIPFGTEKTRRLDSWYGRRSAGLPRRMTVVRLRELLCTLSA